jgi:hypothetical protein
MSALYLGFRIAVREQSTSVLVVFLFSGTCYAFPNMAPFTQGAISSLTLATSDLLTRGYFHDRIIPPLGSTGLAPALTDLLGYASTVAKSALKAKKMSLRSRCVQHSVPKRKLSRRILSIPNPLHQTILCLEVEKAWKQLLKVCSLSKISLTRPKLSSKRAIEATFDRREEATQRALRSVGCRYVLKADFARFYPSIYTHSIGWAIHGKTRARRDRKNSLCGNRLDLWIRETQDKQTGGIPVGPDTSYAIAEAIASRIDWLLSREVRFEIKGTRYIDDYHLYFESLSKTEAALAALHRAARELSSI